MFEDLTPEEIAFIVLVLLALAALIFIGVTGWKP
jgi:hypothetical protein